MRAKLLPEKCRELTEKYIAGLSYVNYNMLVVNWDSSNVEDILMPCMFEDIYRIYTGEKFKNGQWGDSSRRIRENNDYIFPGIHGTTKKIL